jgi:hypothetical protein
MKNTVAAPLTGGAMTSGSMMSGIGKGKLISCGVAPIDEM